MLLFPPYLNKGSKDLGPNGPVRKLQQTLAKFSPEFTAELGLIPDGDYGDKTKLMIIALQELVNREIGNGYANIEESIEVDGNFGPTTRNVFRDEFLDWDLDCDEIKFVPGGECMYVGPDSPEPQLWNPLASAEPQPNPDEASTETAG